ASGAPLWDGNTAGLPWNHPVTPTGVLLFLEAQPVGRGVTELNPSLNIWTLPSVFVSDNGWIVPIQIVADDGFTTGTIWVTVSVAIPEKSTAEQPPETSA